MEFQSLARAFKLIQTAITYLIWLYERDTSYKTKYHQKWTEYGLESDKLINKIKALNETQQKKTTQEIVSVTSTVPVEKPESSSKIDYKSHVLNEIKSSLSSDKLFIYCTSHQEAKEIYNWLLKNELLTALGRLKLYLTQEGIVTNDRSSISRLKAWQKMSESIEEAFNMKNWEKIFLAIDGLKIDDKCPPLTKRLNLLWVYYKQLLNYISENE